MAIDRANYTNITTNTTTTITTDPGTLCKVIVNKVGTTSTVTVYDSDAASGSIIASMSSVAVGTFFYDCRRSVGLTIVTAGAAAADITVTWE